MHEQCKREQVYRVAAVESEQFEVWVENNVWKVLGNTRLASMKVGSWAVEE